MRRRDLLGAFIAAGAVAGPCKDASTQTRLPRVVLLSLGADDDVPQFREGMRERGYVEGRTVTIEYRSADGDVNRLGALAREIAQSRPDVMVAGFGTLAPKALRAATDTIPIVFTNVGDPIGAGLVETLSRPGGNVTGLSGQAAELKRKQFQLLLACLPGEKTVGVLSNPDTPFTALALKELTGVAAERGVRLVAVEARVAADISAVRMDAMVAAGATSLFVVEDPLLVANRAEVLAEARRLRLPVMTGHLGYARDGALMSYGAVLSGSYRRAADFTDRILKGARPSDLPVEQPTQFQFILNLRTARALGVTVPAPLLAEADEVIE